MSARKEQPAARSGWCAITPTRAKPTDPWTWVETTGPAHQRCLSEGCPCSCHTPKKFVRVKRDVPAAPKGA